MSVSIIEALQNACHNIDNVGRIPMLLPMVKEQLNNATALLDKGYDIHTQVEPLLEKYGSVEYVPDCSEAEKCDHENEKQMQGDGFIYTVCGGCGKDLD